MRKNLTAVSVVAGLALATGIGQAQAANLSAQETGCPAGQDVCFVPDANFDVTAFTQSSFNAGTDTVTGSGAFAANQPGTGSATVFLTEANGTTVSDILTLTYTNEGAIENMTASYQSDLDGALNLGTVPAGAQHLVENGSSQDVTALLATAGNGTFPSNITVQAMSEVAQAVPAPLIGHGLLAFLAVGGILFGAKFWQRSRNPEAAA
jgi:hypothetical protein